MVAEVALPSIWGERPLTDTRPSTVAVAISQGPSSPPVVALSGYAPPRHADVGAFRAYLTKPVSAGELLEVLRDVLDGPE